MQRSRPDPGADVLPTRIGGRIPRRRFRVNLKVDLEDFALEHTLTTVGDLSCEVERVVATDSETLMPFLWVEASPSDLDELKDAFATDESIDQVDCIARLDGERLYRMQWIRRIDLLVQILVEEDGTILSASGTGDGWHLRLLFPTRESLARTHEYCHSNGIECELLSIYDVDEGRQGRFGLTDAQQDTMTAAFEHGSYEIPRERHQRSIKYAPSMPNPRRCPSSRSNSTRPSRCPQTGLL